MKMEIIILKDRPVISSSARSYKLIIRMKTTKKV